MNERSGKRSRGGFACHLDLSLPECFCGWRGRRGRRCWRACCWYLPTIRSEEEFLREHFAEFAEYAGRVPRLLPRLTAAGGQGEAGRFSSERYLHHREYNALMGAIAIYAALAARLLFFKR